MVQEKTVGGRGEASMTRRGLLGAGAGAAAAAAATFAAPGLRAWARPPARRPPNIVYVLADDLGYGALGAYGQKTIRTPNLDRLAAGGIRFTDGYAAAPICAPSRCCFLTGMHNGHARVRDNSFTTTGVDPAFLTEDTTIGQVLQAAGYATGIFGKWGFGHDHAYVNAGVGVACDRPSGGPKGDLHADADDPSHPLQKGFDEFMGFITHNHSTEGYWANYIWDGNERVVLPDNAGEKRGTYCPELYFNRALDFVERHRDVPFFCLLTPQLVHWPRHVPTTAPYGDEPWTDDQKHYAAQHTLLDAYVGRLVAKLEELGLAGDTVVFFTSDNGPTPEEQALFGGSRCTEAESPAPDSAAMDKLWDTTGGLRGDKHSLYEGGIRVPMIVWGPGVVRRDAATVTERPWASYDVLPTLADFAGVTAPSDVDGVSLRGWITGEAGRDAVHGPLYWERPPYLGPTVDASPPVETVYAEAARDGRWKGVRYAPGVDPTTPSDAWMYEVYDLVADRGETTNVAALQPAVRARLEAIMERSHAPQPYHRAPYRPSRTR
jgi:arylsulfatase A